MLCANNNEDKDHLFSNAHIRRMCWVTSCPSLILRWVPTMTSIVFLVSIKQAQDKFNSSNTCIYCIICTSIIWNIWCERNNRVFNGIEQPFKLRTKQILLDSKHLIQERIQAHNLSMEEKLILMKLNGDRSPRSFSNSLTLAE